MRGGDGVKEENWDDNEFEGWRLILVIGAIFVIGCLLNQL